MEPGSPMSPHLRRRRDLEGSRAGGFSQSGAGGLSAAGGLSEGGLHGRMPSVGLPVSTAGASLDISSSGARTSSTGGLTRRQVSGVQHVDHPKDAKEKSSAPTSTTGAAEVLDSSEESPKIGAYLGPVDSITKHYFMANYNIDSDARSQAASSAAKSLDDKSVESDVPLNPKRDWIRTHAYIQGLTMMLLVGVLVLSLYNVTTDIINMKAYYALFVYGLVPLGVIFFSFAAGCAIKGAFSVIMGGTSPMDRNSQNYSAIKTPVPPNYGKLPQIVVQMPVYKESLEGVIALSYFNVKQAMDYYVSKGGSAKFIICDDGFQVISQEEQWARTAFYEKHNIAFVARPGPGRRGVFKKASNLNYQLAITDRVAALAAEGLTIQEALLKVWEERDREFVAAGDLTMDDDCLILLIDADTKVPAHCMWDVVGEFIASPEVSYTQHFTTPFDEQNRNYWEQHISAFTRIIYFQGIAMSVAFGDCAPLVGHNAFLRWSSVKQVGYHDKYCRTTEERKYWSECSVSEDFDMYIRLAQKNMFGRYVMYTGPDFQEGVSLTYMDEVIKFKKFAYGACEMLFNPLKLWPTKGPFNKLFVDYISNKHIKWYQKVSMLTYLSSYLAMASAFYYVVFEGVMSIVQPGFHDYFVPHSFDIMLTGLVIFGGIGTVCGGIIFQWRRTAANRKVNMFKIIYEQLKWLPTTIFFFNSVLFHMTEVCAIYFLGLPVVWGATAKETTNTTCWKALRETLYGYRYEYCVYVSLLVAYSICMWNYNIDLYRAWAVMSYACGHIIGPIALNPNIMALAY